MNKDRIKVCILTPFELPVPAIKGGAVEGLIDIFIENFSQDSNIDLSVVVIDDENAKKLVKLKYKNINFIYVKKNSFIFFLDKLYEFFYTFLKLGKKHEYPKKYFWKLFTLFRCKGLLKKNRFDKVIIENAGYLLNVFRNKNIRKIYKDKYYFHIHNVIPNNIYMEGLNNSKIIVISEYLKNDIIKRFLNIDKKKITVLKNGIKTDLKFDRINKNIERKALGISENEIVICFVGRIVEEKGIEELICAIRQMNNKKIKLLIIGSHNFGDDNQSDFSKKMELQFQRMNQQIVFTGFVDHDNVWKYYYISDFAVLPSKWEEPAGLTMIEASACGLPIITTNSGGILEYIDSNYSIIINKDKQLINNLKTGINEMIQNYDKYLELAQKQKSNIIKNFDEKVYYDNFIKIIDNKG